MPPVRQYGHRRQISSESSRERPSRLEGIRTGVNHMFSGRSRVAPARSGAPESPKTPRLASGLGNSSTTRLAIPYITRSNTNPSQSTTRHDPHSPISTAPITAHSLRQQTTILPTSSVPPHVRHDSQTGRRFVGVDPAELHLASLADSGRRRRRNKAQREPRCAPKLKNKKIRTKILSCFISGLFLTLILTVYLALALSNHNESQEFHVLLILIILITTIFFCHSLIRLCMLVLHPPADDTQELPSMIGPGGYANPVAPIRVALTRDEEAAGIESEATKLPPPAYGLWRESVRVDPNRIYWQRNEAAALERQNSIGRAEGRPLTANRPPSYISENGIDYVVEAEPRSIAPTVEVPLPIHPSERGRGPMR